MFKTENNINLMRLTYFVHYSLFYDSILTKRDYKL